jgi:hypothetical protein
MLKDWKEEKRYNTKSKRLKFKKYYDVHIPRIYIFDLVSKGDLLFEHVTVFTVSY